MTFFKIISLFIKSFLFSFQHLHGLKQSVFNISSIFVSSFLTIHNLVQLLFQNADLRIHFRKFLLHIMRDFQVFEFLSPGTRRITALKFWTGILRSSRRSPFALATSEGHVGPRRSWSQPTDNEKSLERKRESTERGHEAAGHFDARLECGNPYLNDKYPFFKSRVKNLLQTPGHVGFRKWVLQSNLSTEVGCGAHFPWKVLRGCSTISKW